MELAWACWRLWPTFRLPRSFACQSKIAAFGCPPSMVGKNAWDCRLSVHWSLRRHSNKWPGPYPPEPRHLTHDSVLSSPGIEVAAEKSDYRNAALGVTRSMVTYREYTYQIMKSEGWLSRHTFSRH